MVKVRYIVRLHTEQSDNESVEPVTISAESAIDAARQVAGVAVVELPPEEQHNAIAVVTLDDQQSSPRFYGSLKERH